MDMAEKITKEEIEKLIIELGKSGMTSEKIGLILKKEHNVKVRKFLGKRISNLLKKNNININPDIENIKKSLEKLKKHLSKNKQDQPGKRALIKKEAKLRKLQSI